MRSLDLLLLAALLSPLPAVAQPAATCADAAVAAERSWSLPSDLLGAVGRVESGRLDPAGRLAAWPWTVNADGLGYVFASVAEAAAAVRMLQARGARFIDVGCFQVDLFYHPDAFASVEQAFDPVANADYAARFLTELRARTESWAGAVAGYHSLGPAGEGYRQKVMAQWYGTDQATAQLTAAQPPANATRAAPRGGATLPQQRRSADPFVVAMSAAARAIPVFGPTMAPAARLFGFNRGSRGGVATP
jgi:hypothetical protein